MFSIDNCSTFNRLVLYQVWPACGRPTDGATKPIRQWCNFFLARINFWARIGEDTVEDNLYQMFLKRYCFCSSWLIRKESFFSHIQLVQILSVVVFPVAIIWPRDLWAGNTVIMTYLRLIELLSYSRGNKDYSEAVEYTYNDAGEYQSYEPTPEERIGSSSKVLHTCIWSRAWILGP